MLAEGLSFADLLGADNCRMPWLGSTPIRPGNRSLHLPRHAHSYLHPPHRVLRQSRSLPSTPRTMALTRLLYLEHSIEKGLNMPAAMDTDLMPKASVEQ